MVFQLLFIFILVTSIVWFSRNIRQISRNIALGKDKMLTDQPVRRTVTMLRVAFAQGKLLIKPIPGIMHFIVYAGFVLINIEVLEILIDGTAGTHRIFSSYLGGFYNFLIGGFEILAFLVWVACVVFLARRNIMKLKRFSGVEMVEWPKSDANIILFVEIFLMSAFLLMDAADLRLQTMGFSHYIHAGSFPISSWFAGLLPSNPVTLEIIERGCWWFHIVGILAFLNYLPYSKHLHILFAFPNTYFSNLSPKGKFDNMQSVHNEVQAMLDPSFTPPDTAISGKFGAKDVTDLSWKNLMDSYSCTECGRCTSECPANMTGKLLSPRKIMMDTRDRVTELGAAITKNGPGYTDGKSLLGDYITAEELWACTSCNACTEACPINIDPLNIIVELRRYLVMEESQAPASLTSMFSNIENNGAPWQFSPADRLNWAKENA